MTNQQLWQAVLGELELSLSKASFTTWFQKTFILEVTDSLAVVGVPNTFTKTWLEKKFQSDITKTLDKITKGQIKKVDFRVSTARPETQEFFPAAGQTAAPVAAPAAPEITYMSPSIEEKASRFGLNPRYIFKNFVVGKNNELAHAAAQAIAKNPGRTYNPFFIYGGVGLGKTHLMQAIGHKILELFPHKKILYVNSEKFTNDFIKSIHENTVDDFRRVYRFPDVLLVDDVQFFAGKEGTQEEFFHTFNDLHQENKQIIVTSDRPPKAISSLEERLTSRFEWGLIADIGAPDFEMRIAILESKCIERSIQMDNEVLHYIANNFSSNIRELEGALNKILALIEVNKMEPTLENAKKILASWTTSGSKKKAITAKNVLTVICDFYDLSLTDLIGACREKRLVVPRQIAMYLLREELKASFPGIGQEMGGRDHTTAMHACTKIKRELETDEKMRQEVSLIKQRIYS
ncbi:MAG: chromosomal replication initiator protein DnaA [Patescibacteria group bacterium]|jgi:chromosomal replication initiator protein